MTKYRLKKDAPMDKAGTIFELHDDCEYEWLASDECKTQYQINRVDNFDEWFEVVEEPEWVRKQIKKVHDKGTRINYRVVKAFYLPIGEWTSEHKTAFRMEPGDVAGFTGYDEDVKGYINQMVKLGYIEVEDNPNIVWEDEDD